MEEKRGSCTGKTETFYILNRRLFWMRRKKYKKVIIYLSDNAAQHQNWQEVQKKSKRLWEVWVEPYCTSAPEHFHHRVWDDAEWETPLYVRKPTLWFIHLHIIRMWGLKSMDRGKIIRIIINYSL